MKKKLLVTTALIMMCVSVVSCGPKGGDSSSASSSTSSSEAESVNSSVSIETAPKYVYNEPNWDWNKMWGDRKATGAAGGQNTYGTYYDKYPKMTSDIAFYNYLVLQQEVDPALCLKSSLFTERGEAEGAEYFAELARKIVPDWDSNESKTDPAKQTKNVATIYDYVVSHTYYDNLSVERNAVTKGYTLLGMMNNSDLDHEDPYDCRIYTVCRGYCNLLNVMLNGIGIPCFEDKGRSYNTVSGKIDDYSDHVWNEAYYAGAWHILDATWDSNVAGTGYWYNCDTGEYSAGSYDNSRRMFFDIIPDYSSFTDCRNYTNYYQQSHIIEYRNDNADNVNCVTNAFGYTEDGFGYYFDVYDAHKGVIEVNGYNGTAEEITTPSKYEFSFKYNDEDVKLEYPVAAIANRAFKGNETVKKITVDVAEGVEEFKVKDSAFMDMTALEEVTFNKGITYVQTTTAFKNDKALTKITFLGDPVETNGNILKAVNSTVYYDGSNSKWADVLVADETTGVNKYCGRPAVVIE